MKNPTNTSFFEGVAHTLADVALGPGGQHAGVARFGCAWRWCRWPALVAAGLIATGLSGCADMSGIAPQASLRDAPSLGLNTASRASAGGRRMVARFRRRDAQRPGRPGAGNQPQPETRAGTAGARAGRHRCGACRHAAASQWPARPDAPALHRQRRGAAAAGRLHPRKRQRRSWRRAGSWTFSARTAPRSMPRWAARSAAQADAQAARVLLASQVARSYFQLVRLNEQLRVAQPHAGPARRNPQAGPGPRQCRPGHPAGIAPERRRPARGAPAARGRSGADGADAQRAQCPAWTAKQCFCACPVCAISY